MEVNALIDLESSGSADPLTSHLTQDTLQSMTLLYEGAPIMSNLSPKTKTFVINEDVVTDQSYKTTDLGVAVPSKICVPAAAALNLELALATRSTDDVITDLKRGRKNSRSVSAKGNIHSDIDQNIKKIKTSKDLQEVSDEEATDVESEPDEEFAELPKQRKITERNRIRNAVFDSYYNTYAKERAKAPSINNKEASFENQSVKWLVKQSESQKIISTPREYQVELFEKAKEQNIIAVLDTGSGKTLIAVLLLRHILEQELEDRALGKSNRIAFFLVDSVQLIFQQHAVLECNLNQPIKAICGQMGCHVWNKEMWQKHCSENMVIVCTAEILRHCLHYSFISMDRINLLIFDEAHHAKKDHPYARIIKDFYIQEKDQTRLPKIFGMTASPVDARVDIKRAAAELEAILHCQIATASDPSLAKYAEKANLDQIARYEPLRAPFETPLYRQLKSKLGENEIFRKLLRYSKEATSQLGVWCADRIWQNSLNEEEVRRLESKTERQFAASKLAKPLDVFEGQISLLQEARAIVDAYPFQEPQPSFEHLSSKVVVLMNYLRERFERVPDDKCIVFVKQRYTASLLADLFSHPSIGTPHLRVGTLVGGLHGDIGQMRASFRQQVVTLMKFRKGMVNCLFSTSVAEEGLDVPDCNLIIRFDLYSTLIQYIQSRGRARLHNSRYIHMIEVGNREHSALIREVSKNENILRQFCQSLPEDRLLTGNDFDMDHFLAKEKSHRVYKEPTTGAKLNYKMSLLVLSNFVSSLPQSPETSLNPEYVMTFQNKQFVCEVVLPETSPIRGAIGQPASTKQVAKCSAAFEACLLLRKGKYLDANLLSTYSKQLPAMRNAHLAVSSKKREAYTMRTKPEIWSVDTIPKELFLTVFALDDPSCLARPSQLLGMMTRSILPQLPDIPLYFGKGRQTLAQCRPFSKAIQIDTTMLAKINDFTLRVFDDVFSKQYEADPTKMPYFLVPLRSTQLVSDNIEPYNLVDWRIIQFVQEHRELLWDKDTPESFFTDRYIVDLNDGSRKLWCHGVSHDYKPLDPVPPNTAPRTGTRKNNDNIMEYSCSLWAKSRARRTFREDQPVLQAEYISLRRNLLDDANYAESQNPTNCFIIPEPLRISALPTTVVAMSYVFPSIIHRVESYLIALEACNMLHLDIRPDLALEAITKDSDNSEEHGEEHIRFQRGMGNNYERLEFLGDCFLKMATSISLFTQHPTSDEYAYHVKRMLMICNQNLLNNALNLKLYEYIRSQSFNRRAWYPEGLVLKKGKTAAAPKSHKLGDKTIADVSEALIGAALLTHHGTNNVDMAVRAVTELVCSTDHVMTSFEDYYKSYEKPKYQISQSTASQLNLALQVEQKHKYHFRYPRLLRSAFVHPSYPFSYEHVPNYQRLEFLGDSLLDMACINFLFHRYPNRDPQWLTEHKMAMVSNQFLGALCTSLGFHKHLLQFNSSLQKQIGEYVVEITEAGLEAEEEALKAGKRREDRSPDFWVHIKQPPKCLPDMVEAYVGAIFVDSEYNYFEVERFFALHIQPYFEDIQLYDTFANKHPVTFLSNFLTLRMGCVNWKMLSRQLADIGDGLPTQVVATVMIHNQIIVDHEGTSVRYAKTAAAKKALEILTGLPLPEYRATYRCDCKSTDMDEESSPVEEE